MKSCDIMEAVTVSVEEKIFKEWRHEGFIGGFTSNYLNMEIDGEEYVLVLHKVPNGHHYSEFTGEAMTMARAIKQGQHIFIAFQDGEAVLDSQLRPRMYKSREQFEKSLPAWRDGKAELVEYAPTLTQPNEPLTLVELREMDREPVWVTSARERGNIPSRWVLFAGVSKSKQNSDVFVFMTTGGIAQGYKAVNYGKTWNAYRRPPEGEEET